MCAAAFGFVQVQPAHLGAGGPLCALAAGAALQLQRLALGAGQGLLALGSGLGLLARGSFAGSAGFLGLLLGSTVESNFRRAMSQTGGDWTTFFSRPISCVLLIISIIAFCYPIAKAIIHHFKAQKGTAAAE